MSTAKHTPEIGAPWKAEFIEEGRYRIVRVNDDELRKYSPICEVNCSRDGYEPMRTVTAPARAHLIAAAPDLRNGCNALIGLLQLICSRSDMPADIKRAIEDSPRRADAIAAIAKAEGITQ